MAGGRRLSRVGQMKISQTWALGFTSDPGGRGSAGRVRGEPGIRPVWGSARGVGRLGGVSLAGLARAGAVSGLSPAGRALLCSLGLGRRCGRPPRVAPWGGLGSGQSTRVGGGRGGDSGPRPRPCSASGCPPLVCLGPHSPAGPSGVERETPCQMPVRGDELPVGFGGKELGFSLKWLFA